MSIGLCLDLSLPGVCMSLVDPNQTLWSYTDTKQVGSSHRIGTLLSQALSELSLSVHDIEGCVVGVGPGSFTGIKVSLSFLYGFSETGITRRASLGVSNIESLAADHYKSLGAPVACVLKSTKTAGYVSLIDTDQGAETYAWQCLGEQSLLLKGTQTVLRGRNQIQEKLSHYKMIGIGSWPVAQQEIESSWDVLPIETAQVQLLKLMHEKFVEAWPQDFKSELPLPNYIRLASPEEKLVIASTK